MKLFKKTLCLILALVTICSLCACGGSKTTEKTPEELVRAEVESKGYIAYVGYTIGGNELKSSRAAVTNIQRVSDTEYIVNGKVTMNDVYGTAWTNTFDCEVEQDSDGDWSASKFEYTDDSWSKN